MSKKNIKNTKNAQNTKKADSVVKKTKKSSKKKDVLHVGNYSYITANSPFAITEAYKTLRTNLIFSTGDTGCKKYVVTSSLPGEGKTTNSVNLAVSFAQTGKKVLLIDADLRKPRVHKYFEIEDKTGLSNVLSGIFDGEKKDVINKTPVENLDVVYSGHIPPNPIELLASDNMRVFIETVEKIYDFIVIDTPPINVVSDALVLSKYVTGYILVLRSNITVYQSLESAIAKFELANVKPIGIILNDYESNKKEYSSRYKYRRYQYQYYYK